MEVVSIISQNNLGGQFLQVNIDNSNYTIPPFVDRVPTIFILGTRQVVVDDNVMYFLQQLRPAQQAPPQPSHQLEYMSDLNKGISNQFSFIQESEDNITPLGYGFVGQQQQQHDIMMPPQSMKSEKMDNAVIENYKAARDQELASFMPPRSI